MRQVYLLAAAVVLTGCVTGVYNEKGEPFLLGDSDQARVQSIRELERELVPFLGRSLSEVRELILKRTRDARGEVAEGDLVPLGFSERIFSRLPSGAEMESFTWRLLVTSARTTSVPVVTWRRHNSTAYVLTVTSIDGRVAGYETKITPLSESEREWSSKHIVLGALAMGSTVFLVGGP